MTPNQVMKRKFLPGLSGRWVVFEFILVDGVWPSAGNGSTELYYLDGSDTVNGIGFSREGVVYEAIDGD